jgi:hypothetical protein
MVSAQSLRITVDTADIISGTWCELDEKVFKGNPDDIVNTSADDLDASLLRSMQQLGEVMETVRWSKRF